MVRTAIVAASLVSATAQKAGSLTAEKHPKLTYEECTSSGCTTVQSEIVIDSNWRWTHKNGEATNCYTGNLWDKSLCPDAATCTKNCQVEGADKEYKETYGIHTQGNKLELGFVTQGPYTKNIGSRVYLMNGEDKYKMFNLKNKEFTYTVDDSNIGCGLNGALYFVAMDEDGGASKHHHAGAKYGMGYCDAQCPHDLKWINGEANVENWVPSETDVNAGAGKHGSCCTEIDIWEANKISTAFTMHACDVKSQTRCEGVHCGDNGSDRFKGFCDKNGCDIQSRRLGKDDFWGPGSKFSIDSTKPVQVTTQFITSDGTDNGKVVAVKQIYHQNGKEIQHPTYTVNGKEHHGISDSFCTDWVAVTQDGTNFLEKGGMSAVDAAFEKGVVLVMSLWDDHFANMLWLDSIYPTDGKQPGSHRGTCSIHSGDPVDVENNAPHSKVIFSDIKVGPIGSTTGGSSTPHCSQCEAKGYEADKCGCGYCGSYGGCGWTCGHDSSQPPLGPKCTVGAIEV